MICRYVHSITLPPPYLICFGISCFSFSMLFFFHHSSFISLCACSWWFHVLSGLLVLEYNQWCATCYLLYLQLWKHLLISDLDNDAHLLQSFHDLVRCCEFVFINHGNNSAIMQFICLLWSLRPFDVNSKASSILFFKK